MNKILIENYRMAAFQRATEALAKRGVVVKYNVTPSGETHTEIDFGEAWPSIMFDLGYEFHKAEI